MITTKRSPKLLICLSLSLSKKIETNPWRKSHQTPKSLPPLTLWQRPTRMLSLSKQKMTRKAKPLPLLAWPTRRLSLKAKDDEKGKMFATSDSADEQVVTPKAKDNEKENMKIIANDKGMLNVLHLFFFLFLFSFFSYMV